jgi:hypothetical protein
MWLSSGKHRPKHSHWKKANNVHVSHFLIVAKTFAHRDLIDG